MYKEIIIICRMLQTKVNVLFKNIFNLEEYFVAIKTLKKPIKVDKKTKKRNLNLHRRRSSTD